MVKQVTMYQDSKGDYFRTEAEALQAEAVYAREQAVNSAKDKLLDTLKSDHTFDKLDDDRKIAGMVCAYPEPFYELARACLPERAETVSEQDEVTQSLLAQYGGLEGIIRQADAWNAVRVALDEAAPDWRTKYQYAGAASAVAAIDELGGKARSYDDGQAKINVGDMVSTEFGNGRVLSIAERSVKVDLLRYDAGTIQFFDIEDVAKI